MAARGPSRRRRRAALPPPAVTADTLVRIDPATNRVSAVIGVGARPTAAAAGGHSVWVYNQAGPTVSEIDAGRTRPADDGSSPPPPRSDAFEAGARRRRRRRVAHRRRPARMVVSHAGVPGARGKREYRLDLTAPRSRGRRGAVWVVDRGAHDYQVLRIDPATGVHRADTLPRLHPDRRIAVGLGASGSSVRPRDALPDRPSLGSGGTGRLDLGDTPPGPSVVLGSIWVGLADRGGGTVVVDPRTLGPLRHLAAVRRRGATSPAG